MAKNTVSCGASHEANMEVPPRGRNESLRHAPDRRISMAEVPPVQASVVRTSAPEPPNQSATKADWVEYASACGWSRETAHAMTKADLVAALSPNTVASPTTATGSGTAPDVA